MEGELPPIIQTEITEIHHKQLPEDRLCNDCMESNLIERGVVGTFRTCSTCGEDYCIHAASHLDPQYCIFCCNDFQLVDTDEVVVRTVKNENGDVTSKKSFRIRHLKLGGDHYLFYNRAITSMADDELAYGIEYHRGICNGMLREREDRRVAHAHRNKGKVAGNEENSLLEATAAQPLLITGEGAKYVMPSKRVRTVRTKAVAAPETQDAKMAKANKLIEQLIAKGMTAERFAAIMGNGKKTG